MRRTKPLAVELETGGPLAIGYLAEAAVWRVSYRILEPSGDAPTLQAWGIVHNDTNEDWEDVAIELANGEPDSFLYPMAGPRYAARDLVTPPEDLSSVAQLATETADGMWDGDAGRGVAFGVGGLGSRGSGLGGGGSAQGLGGIGTTGAAQLKEADPIQTPTQFIYRVARDLDLPARHSALVPVIHGRIHAEASIAYAPGSHAPRHALWIENDTARTLPAGVLSIVEAGGLAGESQLERLEPDASQLLMYGNELDLDLERRGRSTEVVEGRLEFTGRQIVVDARHDHHHTFALINRSGRAHAVWVAMELSPSQHVEDGVRTEIDPHRGWTWVVLHAPPGPSTPAFTWHEDVRTRHPVMDITPALFRGWAERGLGDGEVLAAAAAQRERYDTAGEQIAAREATLGDARKLAGC